MENKTHGLEKYFRGIDADRYFFFLLLLPSSLISSVKERHRRSIKVRAKVSRYYRFDVKRHLRHRFVMTTTMTISLVCSTTPPIILFYFIFDICILYFSINSFPLDLLEDLLKNRELLNKGTRIVTYFERKHGSPSVNRLFQGPFCAYIRIKLPVSLPMSCTERRCTVLQKVFDEHVYFANISTKPRARN